MPPFLPQRLVTIEVPVLDLERAVAWYQRALGLKKEWSDGRRAMLRIPGGQSLFLVETNDARRLAFSCTSTGIVHSVIDFLVADLAAFHAHFRSLKTGVEELKPGAVGFGFRDPDGNRLGACRLEP